MTEPFAGGDGTEALGGSDALAPPRASRTDALAAAPSSRADALAAAPSSRADALAPAPAPRPAPDATWSDAAPGFPELPVPPVAGDQAAVVRWMDADAVESRRAGDPPVRQAGPVRLLPRDDRPAPHDDRPAPPVPAPAPRPAPRRRPGAQPRSASAPRPSPASPSSPPGEAPEPDWMRERREEHEFRSQFGEWRAAPPRPGRTSTLSPGTVLVLLALVAIVVLIALG